jgi:uncharacterized protein (DUF1697 family)
MAAFISLLRGINVSGQKRIQMTELKAACEALGFGNVRTYVQSGNVVFESSEVDSARLAGMIEVQVERSFGYSLPVFVREAGEFQQLIAANPFTTQRHEDHASLHVTFLYAGPDPSQWSKLGTVNSGEDEFAAGVKEVFLFCPNGYGRTKLSNNFFEKKLGTPATTRNWKTVLALWDLANEA